MKLQKALYRLMRASLLFYRKLHKELEEYGFIVNPYDLCVSNKIVEGGEQLTIIWHVDNLMVSCKVDFELTKFSCYLAGIYGPRLMIHKGKRHDYLRVNLEFKDDGNLEMSMEDYLAGVIEGFPEVITGVAASPAADNYLTYKMRKKEDCWTRKEQSPSITPRHNCCSWQGELSRIFIQQWHS